MVDVVSGKTSRRQFTRRQIEKVYSVAQVAELLSVTKQTVYKFLSLDEPELATIDPVHWFKLPNGHIRIRQKAVLKLLEENQVNSIKELKNKHAGKPIAVLGGGPNLSDDLAQIPRDSILLGVNAHASKLVSVDYFLFSDSPDSTNWTADLEQGVRVHEGRRISIVPGFSDWEMDVDYFHGGMTGTFATWAASYMGGNPILLCGMDCWQSKKVYFHSDADETHICQTYPLENSLNAWRPVLEQCENGANVRAVSGPLVDIFGEY